MKTKYVARLLATVAMVALSQPAFAQSNSTATSPADTPVSNAPSASERAAPVTATAFDPQVSGQEETADTTAASASDIVVTGSRLTSNGGNAPTPVSVITTENLIRTAPTTLADGLNQQPIFQGSISPARGDTVQSNRVRAGNYLNLRALGTARVLVLQDGHRLVPTGNNGGTDANLVPQLLIERVDVVTGGASAAYGSDAVSGVVNFVTAKRFEGVRTLLQKGVSTFGDDASFKAAIAGGTTMFDGRLRLVASAEHYHQDGITSKAARPLGADNYSYGGLGTAASPFAFYRDVRQSASSDNGYIVTGPLAGRQFALGGTIQAFDPGTAIGRGGVAVGGDGARNNPEASSLTPSLTTNQLFGRATFDVTPSLELHAEIGYNVAENTDRPVGFSRNGNLTIFRDNAYLAPNTLAALGSTQSFTVGRTFLEIGPQPSEQRVRSLDINVGLRGKIGSDLSWDVSYVRGRSKFNTDSLEVDLTRFYASVDAVRAADGNIVCRITVTNPGLQNGCVPINTFGNGAVTEAARNYVLQHSLWQVINRLDEVSANVSGSLFNLWAGPVSFAVGGNYRRQSIDQSSNSDPSIALNLTGIRGFAGAVRFPFTNVGIARGAYTIKEQYVEVQVPLLKDSAVGRSLTVNGAARNTNYSTSGTVQTWKIGGVYEPIDGIKARATLSRDIRAPSLFELFAGDTVVQVGVTDPLTRTFGTAVAVSGGNRALTPERAKTLTAGLVLTPSLIPGVSASVDYYDIKISDAITVPYNAPAALNICFAANGNSPACDLITRPLGPTNTTAANFPTSISQVPRNVADVQTRGIDLELGYRRSLFGGTVDLRGLATRLISYKLQQNPSVSPVENAGTADLPGPTTAIGLPKWRATISANYSISGLTFGGQARIVGGLDRSHILSYVDNTVPPVVFTDANASYTFGDTPGKPEMFVTVNNVLNQRGAFWPITGTPGIQLPTVRSLYDIQGRYFTFGIRSRF